MWIEKTDDDLYPYVIKDSWGGKVYTSKKDLKNLIKDIQEILDKDKQK